MRAKYSMKGNDIVICIWITATGYLRVTEISFTEILKCLFILLNYYPVLHISLYNFKVLSNAEHNTIGNFSLDKIKGCLQRHPNFAIDVASLPCFNHSYLEIVMR